MSDKHSDVIVRFHLARRIEHVATMILFSTLVVTGLPQKFFEARWSHAVTAIFGGLNTMRWVHRWAGFLFAASVVVHLTAALYLISTGKKNALSLVPKRKDFGDAVRQLRYYLGLADHGARFGRYDYRQKFEYWGVVVGGLLMTATGFVLFWPAQTAGLLPGEVIPAAKLAHGNEGLLAFLVILIWHIYNAHLNPDVFPFDASIFTGKVSRERMVHEHALELEEMEAAGALEAASASPKESHRIG